MYASTECREQARRGVPSALVSRKCTRVDGEALPPPYREPKLERTLTRRHTLGVGVADRPNASDTESCRGEQPSPSCRAADPKAIQQLELDLRRTHPHDLIVQSRLPMIRDMLVRQAADDPDLSYCQGMNYVATVFAVACFGFEEAYRRFHAFVQRVRGLWLPGFPLVVEGTLRFEILSSGRQWFRHLRRQSIDPSLYLPSMWMPLFATWLPLSTLVQFTDFFEREGFDAIVAITLTIMDHIGEWLLACQDPEQILVGLGPTHSVDFQRTLPEASSLLKEAQRWLPVVFAELDRPRGMESPLTQWLTTTHGNGSEAPEHEETHKVGMAFQEAVVENSATRTVAEAVEAGADLAVAIADLVQQRLSMSSDFAAPWGMLSMLSSPREAYATRTYQVDFEPGYLGLCARWRTGVVTEVLAGGQGESKAVEVGMKFHEVDGHSYSSDVLDRCIAGEDVYSVVFLVPKARTARRQTKKYRSRTQIVSQQIVGTKGS